MGQRPDAQGLAPRRRQRRIAPAIRGGERARRPDWRGRLGRRLDAAPQPIRRLRRRGCDRQFALRSRGSGCDRARRYKPQHAFVRVPERGRRYDLRVARQSRGDHLRPAVRRRRLGAVKSRDVEPLLGARQGDVEKPPIFIPAGAAHRLARVGDGLAVERLFRRPGDRESARLRVIERENPRIMLRRRRAAGIGQEDDLGFEPLRRMHGHDPHDIDAAFHIAPDRAFRRLEIGEEARKRRRRLRLMRERETQKLVDRIGRFRTKPRFKRAPPAILAKQARIKGKGARRGARAPCVEFFCRLPKIRLARGFQRLEETALPPRRDL